MPRILWINGAAGPAAALVGAGFEVQRVGAREAAAAAFSEQPDLIVAEDGDGHILRGLRADRPELAHLPIVVLAPRADRQFAIAARLDGADDVLTGPCDEALLLAVVASRIRQVEQVRTAARTSTRLPRLPVAAATGAEMSRGAVKALQKGQGLALHMLEAEGDEAGVIEALQGFAHDGAAATQLADIRFAVVTDAGRDAMAVEDGLARLLEGVRPQIVSMALAGTAAPEGEMVAALVHALKRFARGCSPGEVPTTLDDALAEVLRDTAARLGGIRRALERRAWRFAYQPVVRLADGAPHHHEALLRFNADELSNTAEVIELVERTGLIAELDLAILDQALAQLQSSVLPSDARLAVNLSGRTVLQAAASRQILDRLHQCRGVAQRLQIELTESAEISDLATANDVVQQIREAGYAVFLDDFGAGAASFRYLHALKVDGVKIDGRYLRNATNSDKDVTLLKGMVRLAADLGLATVAECVETEAQAQLLRELGVGYGQGWLFGKPSLEIKK